MRQIDLITAFDDCLDRIHSGESLEVVLRDYPSLAAMLRPMLETAAAVRRSAPDTPSAARSRARMAVLGAADRMGYTDRWRFAIARRVTFAAAVLMLVLFGAWLILWFEQNNDTAIQSSASPTALITDTATPAATIDPAEPTETAAPTGFPTPTTTSTPTATPSATPTPTASPTPTHTPTATPDPCVFTVTAASISLRQGPGTGYGIVGYGYADEVYPVLAQHSSGAWLQIDSGSGPVWAAISTGSLSGSCDDLPVSDETFLDAQDTPAPPVPTASGGEAGGSGDDAPPGDDSDDSDDDEPDEPDESDEPEDEPEDDS